MDPASGIPVLVIFGPTASGKTALAERLFTGDGPFSGKAGIVSADSMQVYRGMDIGTAKPSREFLAKLPHALIDLRDPDEAFGVGDFVPLADEACSRFMADGRIPVLLGGTGFYIRNFIFGLPETPPSDGKVRRELQNRCREEGLESLRRELAERDAESAARIHPNDEYRIIRALEVLATSGRSQSDFRVPIRARDGYRFLVLSLERARDELYRRIDLRVDEMFREGLAGEVEGLVRSGYGPECPGLRAIGYREFFMAGTAGAAEIADLIKANTRKYAKRQETYVRSIPGVRPVGADDIQSISSMLADFLST